MSNRSSSKLSNYYFTAISAAQTKLSWCRLPSFHICLVPQTLTAAGCLSLGERRLTHASFLRILCGNRVLIPAMWRRWRAGLPTLGESKHRSEWQTTDHPGDLDLPRSLRVHRSLWPLTSVKPRSTLQLLPKVFVQDLCVLAERSGQNVDTATHKIGIRADNFCVWFFFLALPSDKRE